MIYKDRHTVNSWSKEVNKIEDPNFSLRKYKRMIDRDLKKFILNVSIIVDRDWWDCVSQEKKKSLYNDWCRHKVRNYNKKTPIPTPDTLTLAGFINSVKKDITIDMSLFRDKKLNKIVVE